MPSPLKSIVSAFAALALLAGCTGGLFPERQVDPVPLLVADEPLWGVKDAPLGPVRFVDGLAVLRDGQLLSVRDAETGELIWRQGYDVEVVGGVGENLNAVDPIVVGSGANALLLAQFNSLYDRAGNWHSESGYGGVLALSLQTGQLVWRSDTVEVDTEENLGASVRLVDADDELALVQVYGHEPGNQGHIDYRLLALDVSDGSVLWSVPGVRGEYLSGDTVGVTLTGTGEPTFEDAITGNGVAVLDAATGAERWRLEAEDRKVAAGNAHVLAMAPGTSAGSLEIPIEILAAADGTELDTRGVEASFCEASDELLACNDGHVLMVVDAESKVASKELDDYASVHGVHGDVIMVNKSVSNEQAPTVWTAGPTQVASNLPGTMLGQGEGYVAVAIGSEWTGDIVIYRQVTAPPSDSPTPLPRPDFTVPTDPGEDDYQPPRPDPLAAPITLGEQLWQAPAPGPSAAQFLGDALVVRVNSGSNEHDGSLSVLDASTGTLRWTLPDGALLPGGSGEYFWNEQPYSHDSPLLLVDGPQPLVLVNYKTNSCGTTAADCQGQGAFTTGFGVAALSLADGSLVWRHAVAERTAVDASDDSTFWDYGMAMLAGIADGVVVFTTQAEYYQPNPDSDVITALAADSGAPLWSVPGLLAKAVTGDVVFAVAGTVDYDEGNTDDTIALELRTGERKWAVEVRGFWPIAANATHVAVVEVTWGSAGMLQIRSAADGSLVTDLGRGHWQCATLPELLACESIPGIKMVPDQGDQWLLNVPDGLAAGSLDAAQGERYFASTHSEFNGGAADGWMLDRNGTPLGEPLPGRVLAISDDLVLLIGGWSTTLYRYQG